jgi:hypothetical protein
MSIDQYQEIVVTESIDDVISGRSCPMPASLAFFSSTPLTKSAVSSENQQKRKYQCKKCFSSNYVLGRRMTHLKPQISKLAINWLVARWSRWPFAHMR